MLRRSRFFDLQFAQAPRRITPAKAPTPANTSRTAQATTTETTTAEMTTAEMAMAGSPPPPADPAAEDPNKSRWADLLRVMLEDNQVALDQSDEEDGSLEGEDEITPLFSELSIAQQSARHENCLLTTLAHSPFYVIFSRPPRCFFVPWDTSVRALAYVRYILSARALLSFSTS